MLTTLKSHYADSTIAHIKARAIDLGKIHEAKSQLNLSDADYRALVKKSCKNRTESSAYLCARERTKLLRDLKSKGYVEKQSLSERSLKIQANRLRDLGIIHMGQRALGIDDASYRKLIHRASGGVSKSSAMLAAPQRAKVIAEMKRRGFVFQDQSAS